MCDHLNVGLALYATRHLACDDLLSERERQ